MVANVHAYLIRLVSREHEGSESFGGFFKYINRDEMNLIFSVNEE